MATPSTRTRVPARAALPLASLASLLLAGVAAAEVLPWEANVTTVEAGSLRGLAERLNKQNLLFKLRLGDVRKDDMVETARRIDAILLTLQAGDFAHSVPPPWTPGLREGLAALDRRWYPLRRIAIASVVESLSGDFVPGQSRSGDPLLLRHFDRLTDEFLEATEELLAAYYQECQRSGFAVCDVSRTSGYAVMLVERIAREAISVFAGFETAQSREQLDEAVESYREVRARNDESDFFQAAVNPKRGSAGERTGEILESIRSDWAAIESELAVLGAGDVRNFDPTELLGLQEAMVRKIERLTAALVQFASITYGS